VTATYHAFDTPIGSLRLVGDENSIDRIDLPNWAVEPPDPAWTPSADRLPAALAEAKRQLEEYFAG